MTDKKQFTQENEVLEFLNSLPEQKSSKTKEMKEKGKTDQEILDFLDELEATEKGEDGASGAASEVGGTADASAEVVEAPAAGVNADVSTDAPAAATATATDALTTTTSTTADTSIPTPVNDPITSISNWWKSGASTKVTSQISSIWESAQTLGGEAQKRADNAIKKAREQGVEDNLKKAFQEFGISGVLEGDRELTENERAELLKLPDTRKALKSIDRGISLFSSQLTGVLSKLNSKDEVLNMKLVHDFKNYPNLAGYVKRNFEDVMNSQVDGNIEVNVAQSGTKTPAFVYGDNQREMGLFQGKLSDAERLVQANIESIVKENAKATSDAGTDIYIGLLAVSVNKDFETKEDDDKSITVDEYQNSSFCFTAALFDKTHNITITNRSQPFPLKWCRWLDGTYEEEKHESSEDEDVDPSAWVIDWIEQGLDSTFGVLAQTYVIMRMGY
ncbi:hypothetical protein FOA43_004083 [Brettanomyces nanus]|uniref:Uncharacterized protein n=1 Tax=Eeniella nana TaxID=13502 RepID=A0A875SAV0_EENNA|nr:uncharacterized protein FOA43_004083 [Brettanomyces nanus]QPG76689.1 hypothetical protein FOA43_004083 [Brettanomyces nanus]